MPTSRDLPADRLAIGQLLVGLLRQFRAELFQAAAERGYPDLREPHLHIFGNVGVDGIRLTDLAARAQLSLATTSELVSELQRLGYLERRADGTDRRAKLIFPTPRGRQALDDAGDQVAQLEQRWAHIAGPQRFADTCRTLQDLLDTLTSNTDGPDPAAVAAKVTEASHTGPATEDVIRGPAAQETGHHVGTAPRNVHESAT
jgi:DNA-binding MarR family transcriptional regulator